MTTFAHIEQGAALDPQLASSSDEYLKRFAAEVTKTWLVSQVPDGTLHGAKSDGHGGWINPAAPPAPAAVAILLGGSDFHTYAAGVLAQVNNIQPLQGMARLGDIIAALETAAAHGGLCRIAFERYRAAGVPDGRYNVADVTQLLGALQQANIVTAGEATALVSGWPKQ